MKSRLLVLLIIFSGLTHYAQSQFQSGILINGGLGAIKTELNSSTQEQFKAADINYKYNLSLGYRFRIIPSIAPILFVDLDANVGFKLWNSAYIKSYMEPPIFSASSTYYFVSAAGTINYPIYKGFSVGAGFEPTYYFRQGGEGSNKKFDIPVIAKAGYKFNKFELGVTYKLGLMNTLQTNYLSSGKFRDLQLSLWVPF